MTERSVLDDLGRGHDARSAVPDGEVVSVRLPGGGKRTGAFSEIRAADVVRGVPWRTPRSAMGQRHYPGLYWSETAGGHLVYESRLELDRLILADFTPEVVAIAAQPFQIQARVAGRSRRHVPDFLLLARDRTATVVNVKPASRLAEPEIREALAWPGILITERGWEYEIWSGCDPVLLANVRFLAGYRRSRPVAGRPLDLVLAAVRPGDCLAALERRAQARSGGADVRPAILRLLWERRLTTDLSRPLGGDSPLEGP